MVWVASQIVCVMVWVASQIVWNTTFVASQIFFVNVAMASQICWAIAASASHTTFRAQKQNPSVSRNTWVSVFLTGAQFRCAAVTSSHRQLVIEHCGIH